MRYSTVRTFAMSLPDVTRPRNERAPELRAFCLTWLMLAGAAHAEATLAERLDAALKPLFKSDAPGAAVIVTKDGEPVFRKAYGLADVDKGAPLLPEMQLRLGSVTKQFTAVAILMLAEQGKLSLQDEITRFLPDYPVRGRHITIEQLLQHTAGIPNYTGMMTFSLTAGSDRSVQQMIDYFKDEALDFEPGERWAYSNSGYFLLGAIIERCQAPATPTSWPRIFSSRWRCRTRPTKAMSAAPGGAWPVIAKAS